MSLCVNSNRCFVIAVCFGTVRAKSSIKAMLAAATVTLNIVPEGNNETGDIVNTVDEGSECDKLKEERQGVFVDMPKHLDDNQAGHAPAIRSFINSYTSMSTESPNQRSATIKQQLPNSP